MNSLARRAAIAVTLMVSFYALALTLAGVLLWIAWADITYTQRAHGRIILFCVVAAGSVLWAILPRPDKFEPPGPRVTKIDEPALFTALHEVAQKTDQEMPAEVYLVNDVNAFVTSRGGVMGFGSRRVMGLGLPLMQAVTVQEFKAILAHEFGHYHGGDVALGPWIYKTRAAIGRTIQQLDEHVLQFIFVWYGNLFLRVTHAVSRNQEFVADQVAARAAGAGVMISGLRNVHATAVAYQSFLQQELAPVLQRGYLPPVHDGFARFLGNPAITTFLDAVVKHEEEARTTSLFDTHPSLKHRIAALKQFPEGSPGDSRRASSLLSNLGRWERLVLVSDTGPEWARDLKPIAWDKVFEAVYAPMWRSRLDRHGHILKSCTIATLPSTRPDLVRLGASLFDAGEESDDNARFGRAWQLILAAIALHLSALGWAVEVLPGDETILRRDGDELRPFSELQAVVDGRAPATQWRDRCEALGIADVPLWGAVVASS